MGLPCEQSLSQRCLSTSCFAPDTKYSQNFKAIHVFVDLAAFNERQKLSGGIVIITRKCWGRVKDTYNYTRRKLFLPLSVFVVDPFDEGWPASGGSQCPDCLQTDCSADSRVLTWAGRRRRVHLGTWGWRSHDRSHGHSPGTEVTPASHSESSLQRVFWKHKTGKENVTLFNR